MQAGPGSINTTTNALKVEAKSYSSGATPEPAAVPGLWGLLMK